MKAFLPELSKANASLSTNDAEIVTIVDKTAEEAKDSDDSETEESKSVYVEMVHNLSKLLEKLVLFFIQCLEFGVVSIQ